MPPLELARNVIVILTALQALTNVFPLRQRKGIGVEILLTSTFADIDQDTGSDLASRYQPHPTRDGHAILVEIENIGKSPITRDDFVTPLKLSFGDDAKILKADVVTQTPTDLAATVEIIDNKVHLFPVLFNPNDSAVIEVLVQVRKIRLRANGRIVGITKFKRRIPRNIQDGMDLVALYCVFFGLIAANYSGALASVGAGLIMIGAFWILVYTRLISPMKRLDLKQSIGRRYKQQI